MHKHHQGISFKKNYSAIFLGVLAILATPQESFSQTNTGSSDTSASAKENPVTADKKGSLTRVEITGSNIKRTDTETASPVQVITAQEMHQQGYTSVKDVLANITANGQGTLSQSFSGAFASGAAGVALRGLSVGATLVLIDGHRMAPFPAGDDGQRSFVDISNIPFESIERIEVLKDGASAVYGSDAMAGVVNVILKKQYIGNSFTVDVGQSYMHDGQTTHLSAIKGWGDLDEDGHNFYIALESRGQKPITFDQRGGIFTQTDYTSTGGVNLTPGVPTSLNQNLPGSTTGYIPQNNHISSSTPNSADYAFFPGCNFASFASGGCAYSNRQFLQIQPQTDNLNLVLHHTQLLPDDWKMTNQFTYFESKAQQVNGAGNSFPYGYSGIAFGPGIGPTPLSIGRTTVPNGYTYLPPGAIGGPLYYNFMNLGGQTTNTDARSLRLISEIEGHLGTWDVKSSIGTTAVLLGLNYQNLINPIGLQTALNNNLAIGSGGFNALAAPELNTNQSSRLSFFHIDANRPVAKLAGGDAVLSLGADAIYRNQYAIAPDLVIAGQYTGSAGNNFTIGTQHVNSLYTELLTPWTKQFETELAARYDNYNISGGHVSPKFGFKFKPLPELALRGTLAGGFRAPSPAENGTAGQSFYTGPSSDPILCANPGGKTGAGNYASTCNVNYPFVQTTNPNLQPETSKSATLGFIFEPNNTFNTSVDLYAIQIDNQIVTGSSSVLVRGTNLTPIGINNPDGTVTVQTPPVAPISYYQSTYVNANSTYTNGLDVTLQYKKSFEGIGSLNSILNVTYINQYDITVNGVTYNLAGTHGPTGISGDTGNPKTRIKWMNTFTKGPLQVTGTLNYIGAFDVTDPSSSALLGYDQSTCATALANQGGTAGTAYQNMLPDQIPANTSCRVNAFVTFDLYANYQANKNLSIHASVLNLFNAPAPLDWATYGGALGSVPWNPSMALQGAIGRFMSVGATYTF